MLPEITVCLDVIELTYKLAVAELNPVKILTSTMAALSA
jgi:hypothetical protein